MLDTLGLAATIEWHVRQFQKCTGVLYELTVRDVAGFDLPEDYAAVIFDGVGLGVGAGARNAGTTVTVSLPIQPASALTMR